MLYTKIKTNVKKQQKRKERQMENDENLFRKEGRNEKRERSKNENSVLAFVERITELNEILPYIGDPIDKNSMKYLSTLYSEAIELIKDITIFVVNKRYCGMRKNIDDAIFKSQELICILKEFKRLDISRKSHGFIDEVSQTEASLLLRSLKCKMSELLAIRKTIVGL